jgi:CBS domain containing-hemolysin-like protein
VDIVKVKYNFVPKEEVAYCPENYNVQQAYDLLKETGYRCVPVLSEDGSQFKGQIYKVHILEYLYEENGYHEDSIEALIKNKEALVTEDDSFFKSFLTIRRLPFLGVMNETGEFSGILTHANVMDVLEDSFGMRTGGYTLTITTHEEKGALKRLFTQLKDYNVEGLLTLDNGEQYIRRIVVNLPKDLTEQDIDQLIKKLEPKGFRVPYVDKI